MNIFALDKCPVKCAEYMVDKHVVKMILETAQLLSTAHRILDGDENGVLKDERESVLYKKTHVNHPSAKWARATHLNYEWLFRHFKALLAEYTYRYEKIHKCESMVDVLSKHPNNIQIGYFIPVYEAMPDEYIVSRDPVINYRKYYNGAKRDLFSWKKRDVPFFIEGYQC